MRRYFDAVAGENRIRLELAGSDKDVNVLEKMLRLSEARKIRLQFTDGKSAVPLEIQNGAAGLNLVFSDVPHKRVKGLALNGNRSLALFSTGVGRLTSQAKDEPGSAIACAKNYRTVRAAVRP